MCATFATVVLTIGNLRSVNFESTFLSFFGEPAFFKVVLDMIAQEDLRESEQLSYGSLLFSAGFFLQMHPTHPDRAQVAAILSAYVESELENSL